MEAEEVRKRLHDALHEVVSNDGYLLENNLGERCIAARLMMYLQQAFPEYAVDAEYNRAGNIPKKLGLPDECANHWDKEGRAFVVPDVIVHRRGPDGPNLLVLELKKTTNPEGSDCDRMRVHAFRAQLGYRYGALILCETRNRQKPAMTIVEWIDDRNAPG
jgi:hypothetical protein